ncbi:MAG TPA: hypothetical protein PKA54_06960 [Chitinophagaceae bacterium]|nr:hypothetical protein [Chitinophagaceae bacterium]
MMHFLYIDPGSSSLIIQMLVAGALGISLFFKTIWRTIKSFFVKKESDEIDTD